MARRILIVKTTSMGDVIHTLTAVVDIVTAVPNVVLIKRGNMSQSLYVLG